MWSIWVGFGLSDQLFWQLTYEEIEEVFKRKAEQERRSDLRAALVAATIVNVRLKKGAKLVQPTDFLHRKKVHMSVDEAMQFMDGWAAAHNEHVANEVKKP